MANSSAGWYERRRRPPVRRSGGRVVSALFFFPRGGSAQVARAALCRALPTIGWEGSPAAGSLGSAGEQGWVGSLLLKEWGRRARAELRLPT